MAPPRLHPSVLVALGLLEAEAIADTGPCLDIPMQTAHTGIDTEHTGFPPCLDGIPPVESDTGPCLDFDTGPCLDFPPVDTGGGEIKGGGDCGCDAQGNPLPAAAALAAMAVVARRRDPTDDVLERGVLPDDVAELLRRRK